MLFTEAIVIVDKSKDGINAKLHMWRKMLESKRFKKIPSTIEYMECRFDIKELY